MSEYEKVWRKMNEQIKIVSKYIKSKYPGRYTLKIAQATSELNMDKYDVKELIANKELKSLSIKSVATYIVNNPPKKREAYAE